MKLHKWIVAAVLALGVSTFASAQYGSWGWQDRDHDRDRGREGSQQEERSEAFQDGFRKGQQDRVHNRGFKLPNGGKHWEDRAYREAYERGYRKGYGYGRDGDNDRDDGVAYRRNPGYGNGGYGYPGGGQYGVPGPMNANTPQQMGYQDGYQQGLGDRNNGHSFRPTTHGYYSDGDHGYSSAWGSKGQYQQIYRQAYMNGYQRGYYGR